jgi:hypothetical protein
VRRELCDEALPWRSSESAPLQIVRLVGLTDPVWRKQRPMQRQGAGYRLPNLACEREPSFPLSIEGRLGSAVPSLRLNITDQVLEACSTKCYDFALPMYLDAKVLLLASWMVS